MSEKTMSVKGQNREECRAQILRKHGMINTKVEQGSTEKVISSFMTERVLEEWCPLYSVTRK